MNSVTHIFNIIGKLEEVYQTIDAIPVDRLTQDQIDSMYVIQKLSETLTPHRKTIEKLASMLPATSMVTNPVVNTGHDLSTGIGMAITGLLTPIVGDTEPFDSSLEQDQLTEFQEMMDNTDVESMFDMDLSDQ